MGTLQGDLQAQCRSVAGTAGTFNEDLYAALCITLGLTLTNGRHLSGLIQLGGGLPALLANPSLITSPGGGQADFSGATNSGLIVVLLFQ